MLRNRLTLGTILVCGFLLILPIPSASAAGIKTTKSGITLSPFEQQISIASDDPNRTFNLDIINNTTSLQELNLSARDFGSLNDTGGVLLEGSKGYSQKYGLTSWLSLGTDTVTLQPSEKRSVPVTIENRTSLQPGGHYGAVVASVTSLNDQSSNRVVINQQLLSLILVKKVGGEKYNLRLKNVTQNGNWLHLPTVVKLRFQNPGNVHVVPRGELKLKSPSGKVIAHGIINSESAYILPETFRELYVPLTKIRSSYPLPGVYSVEVDYRYDGLNVSASKSYATRYINLKLDVVLLLIIFIIARYLVIKIKKAKHAPQKPSSTPKKA